MTTEYPPSTCSVFTQNSLRNLFLFHIFSPNIFRFLNDYDNEMMPSSKNCSQHLD